MRGIITFLTSKRYLLVWYHGNDVASLLKTDHLKSCIGSDLVNVNKKDMKIYPSLTPKQKDMVTFFSAIPPDWANSLVNYRKHQEIKLNIQGTSLVAQWLRIRLPGFPGGAVVESPPAGAGDAGSGPGLGGSSLFYLFKEIHYSFFIQTLCYKSRRHIVCHALNWIPEATLTLCSSRLTGCPF